MFDSLMAFRKLLAATILMFAASMPATTARAQQIVVIVNGEPITALDIDQRSKLSQLSTHKVPPRQEVLDELINEKLKLREAKKFGLEVTASEVDNAYASMAGRMRFTADQLTQQLARSGVNVSTLKGRIKADIAWAQIVRGRYQTSLQIGEKDILSAMDTKPDDTVGYDYTMRPVLFLIPAGSPDTFIDGRKREAEALRGRFQGCEEGITFARALKDVAVRDQVIRSSADIPAELRKVLEGIEVGRGDGRRRVECACHVHREGQIRGVGDAQGQARGAAAIERGVIREGSTVLLVAFGAGFTWASMIIRF